MGLGNIQDGVPAAGSFLLGLFKSQLVLYGQPQYALMGLDHLIRLHCDPTYWRMTSVEIEPVVAQKYDRDQMEPFFFSSGKRAARVEPEPPLIFPARSAGDNRGGADRARWTWSS